MNQPQVYTCPLPLKPPSHLPPHSTPLGCHKAPAWGSALGSLHHIANSHWLSTLHMVMYMFEYYSLKSSQPTVTKSLFFMSTKDPISIFELSHWH